MSGNVSPKNIYCPNCGAELTLYPGEMLHTCEYCGYSFSIRDKKQYKAFMLKVNYNQQTAFKYMVAWIKKQLGVPEDFEASASLKKVELVFYPFWISSAYAYTQYSGYGRDAEFYGPVPQRPGAYWHIKFILKPERWFVERDYEYYYLAANAPEAIAKYRFAARSREYFDINEVKKYSGKLVQSNMDLETFERKVKEYVYDMQTTHILKEVEKISSRDDKIEIKEIFMVYLPVYHFEYEYKGKRYYGYVDASSGMVIWANAPVKLTTRTFLLVLGGTSTAAAVYLLLMKIIPLIDAGAAFETIISFFFPMYLLFILGGFALYRGITTGRGVGEKLKGTEEYLFTAVSTEYKELSL